MTIVAEVPADLEEPAIRVPPEPQEQPPTGFPVLMTIAPVFVALLLFAILQTPYVLMFAVLGPVLGIANVVDQRIGRRRRLKRERAEFAHAIIEAEQVVAAAHARLLARRRAESPLARDLIEGSQKIAPGVVVGVTTVASGLRVEGASTGDASGELAAQARRLVGAPFVIAAQRIRLRGPRAEVTGAIRALVVQLLSDNPAADLALTGEGTATVAAELSRAGVSVVGPAQAEVLITTDPGIATTASLEIEAGGSAVVTDTEGVKTRVRADSLGAGPLASWLPRVVIAQSVRARAARSIPTTCNLVDLSPAAQDGLAANFLVGASGEVSLDLVADGPHAVIGGTTGSGKSELLIAWIAALARSHSSETCRVLCIDFKGGATFDAIADLPHCVGVVTDLEEGQAIRVVASLRAEVRARESRLRELGARDISHLERGQLSRLVVFVDEFQALVEEHPELQPVFADLGARGRSLGVHLVLCTQRPTGTFRENLLANCAIRLCLRVEQQSDSITLLGQPDGAHLSRDERGRALARIGGGDVERVQVALARPDLVAEVSERESVWRRDRLLDAVPRPWQPPLPTNLAVARVGGRSGSIGYALADLPEEQRQPIVSIEGAGEHLFIVGMAESGKTKTLDALESAARSTGTRVVRIPSTVEEAWDRVDELGRRQQSAFELVLIDDIDSLEQRFSEEHRTEWLERLQRLMRNGTNLGLAIVVTSRRVTGTLQRIQNLCTRTLRLAATSRQDWVMQGGEGADWLSDCPPGRGRLGRTLVQVAYAPTQVVIQTAARERPFLVPDSGLAVVARRAAALRTAFQQRDAEPLPVPNAAAMRGADITVNTSGGVYLGDIDQWNASYGALPRLAEHVPVLAIGLTPGEWRSFFRADPLPPALSDPFSRGLLRHPDGQIERVQLDEGWPSTVVSQA